MSRGECSTTTVSTTGLVTTSISSTPGSWTGAAFIFVVGGSAFDDGSVLLGFFSILPSFNGIPPPSNVVEELFDAALAASRRRAFSSFRACRFSSFAFRASTFAALAASASAAFFDMNDRIATALVAFLLVVASLSAISCTWACIVAGGFFRSSSGAVSFVSAFFNSRASGTISSTLA